jgi:hypothetical protein
MIRFATKYDNNKIIEILKDFAIKSDNALTNNPLTWSKNHVESVLSHLYAGKGFVLVDDEVTGILVALKNQCLWNPQIYQLQEVMLHGLNDIVIARLVKEYIKIAKQKLDAKEIEQALIASYNDTIYERYGLKKLEQQWEIK